LPEVGPLPVVLWSETANRLDAYELEPSFALADGTCDARPFNEAMLAHKLG
jgi:hypothetical protein